MTFGSTTIYLNNMKIYLPNGELCQSVCVKNKKKEAENGGFI